MKRLVALMVLVLAFASLSVAKPAKAKTSPKPAKKNAEVKDARDGQVYRLVKIAGLTWMGDNLNYNAEGSFCLDDDENNCMAYGRLYPWDVAQKACPAGFRVPTHADFEKLWMAAGADFNAGYLLKTNYGWKGDTNGNDTLKFSAMPAGNRFDDGTYGNMAKFAFFYWGLGIGPNPQSPIPNPQSPIPNPQSPN